MKDTIMNLLKLADKIVEKFLKVICIFSLGACFILFIANVFVRFVPIYNFTTTDEWTKLFLVWIVFFGAAEMVRQKGHFMVDILTDKMQGKLIGRICAVIATFLTFALYVLIFVMGVLLVKKTWTVRMFTITFLTQGFFYACVPASAFIMIFYGIRDFASAVKELIQPGQAPQSKAEN